MMAHAKSSPHFRTRAGARRVAQQLYRGIYAGAPTPFLLMTPDFEIIDANDAYLAVTMRQRDSIAGRNMFEAFPDNPYAPEAGAVANLSRSLKRARSSASRDVMPLQRYDVTDPRGNWTLRYWRPVNWPVLDSNGSVVALVHHVNDVTQTTLAERSLQSDILFRRAQSAWEESKLLREETRRRIDGMLRGLPTRR
jgi:PAS domain-containing protein